MELTVYSIFKAISVYIPLVPFIIGLSRLRKLKPHFLSILFMVTTEAIINIYSSYQGSNGINNMPSLHLLIFLEVLFCGYYFHKIINSRRLKKYVILLSILFLSYTTINTFFIKGIYSVIPFSHAIEGYVLVLLSFFFYFDLLKQEKIIPLSKSPEFWISTAIFFYFGTIQLFFLLIKAIPDLNMELRVLFFDIHRGVSNTYYILLSIGLWKIK